MSHIVSITTEIRDAEAVRAACSRLGLPTPVEGTTRLFSGEATGLAVQLPDWKYPVVCELSNGSVQYDNYSGRFPVAQEPTPPLSGWDPLVIPRSRCGALGVQPARSEPRPRPSLAA